MRSHFHCGRRPVALLAACLGAVAVAGCAAAGSAQPVTAAAGRSPSAAAHSALPARSPSAPPQGVNVTAFNVLARQVASAWARSPLAKVWRTGLVVLLAGDLSSGPKSGFPSDETKEAFGNGNLVFTGPPPSGVPAGVVTWANGSSLKVPVLSEEQVFSAMKNSTGARCPGCVTTPLAVTAARPTTLKVPTSRGPASVPAWAFTLQGVSSPVIQAALPPGSYVTPYTYPAPAGKLNPPGKAFLGVARVTASADGRTLTLDLAGSPCDTAWGGLVAEVGGVVVVGGWLLGPGPHVACQASLVGRTATVRLAAPLGGRLVLDAATGRPLSLGSADDVAR